ncbi:hypothetical protein CPLU01_05268 [Colletotrichum plurivorum]|uniref:HNH nuclease domain-containing protein n=1 Tax=Colletotrichum plurivorum TaxID=2175906 RepID=A0A8H6KM76_9PEZI|nr:hypothetical protein CPLU01_05268 [Colletotrichum plurivorum]
MATRRISDGPASYLPQNDIARRQELIWQIHTLSETSNWDGTLKTTSRKAVFWGLLHTLDITGLSNLLEQTRKNSEDRDRFPRSRAVFDIAYRCGTLPRIFIGQPGEAKEGDVQRSSVEPARARERDDRRCIITGWPGTLEVCHIFPFHAINRLDDTKEAILDMSNVWGVDRIQELRRRLCYSSANIIGTAANMLCMDRAARKMWSQGLFALEPMEDNIDHWEDDYNFVEMTGTDGRRPKVMIYGIQLRFHWLKRTTLQSPVARADFAAHPRELWRHEEEPQLQSCLFDTNNRPIESGRIIKVFARDKAWLPDKEILRLQWDLLRMHALMGRADPNIYESAFTFNQLKEVDWVAFRERRRQWLDNCFWEDS